jgi:hypothetical protein
MYVCRHPAGMLLHERIVTYYPTKQFLVTYRLDIESAPVLVTLFLKPTIHVRLSNGCDLLKLYVVITT